ncbi:hypothetical protein FE783_17895 [Paenibacillus mesophilus]|uniref:hypothetical protein n=1 Tax=Paenibacillus mesophilus TaxID=2582849 RepID=UPI00110E69E8|nr:hypothetical protein [Paenibacillus mesophilus]TMV48389.1 hypothetical protein FE783_17895 [Paenibacillus mesophilus]
MEAVVVLVVIVLVALLWIGSASGRKNKSGKTKANRARSDEHSSAYIYDSGPTSKSGKSHSKDDADTNGGSEGGSSSNDSSSDSSSSGSSDGGGGDGGGGGGD